MVIYMKAILKIIYMNEKEYIIGKMAENTMEIGKIRKKKEKEYFILAVLVDMKVIGKEIKEKVQE